MEPLTSGTLSLGGGRSDQIVTDAEALMVGVDHGVEEECVGTAVPAELHEANEDFTVEGTDPGQGVSAQLTSPRVHCS